MTKEELLAAVWPDVAVGDAALAVCVGEIRKLLGDDARTPRYVETVHRRGYRFIGAAPAAGTAAAPPAPAALVGREAESGRLRAWLGQARRGERQVVFVTGEPGIGKTALVEAFLATVPRRATSGSRAASAWSTTAPASRTCRSWRRWTRLAARRAPSARGRAPAPRADVARADARPGRRRRAEPRCAPRLLGATRERMLREMADALEALAAERPLVLLLEDLHWSDHLHARPGAPPSPGGASRPGCC